MNRDKINQMISNFSKKYGFFTELNEENTCNLIFQGDEKLNIEYITDSERVVVYTYLFSNHEQKLSQEQINIMAELNAELFAKTGGIIALHSREKTPILCWGCDVEVLQESDFNNVLENITALTNVAREKLSIHNNLIVKFKLNEEITDNLNIEDFKFLNSSIH